MKINGVGIPDALGLECGSEPPEGMLFPQCLGGEWKSNQSAYEAHDVYIAQVKSAEQRAIAKITRSEAVDRITVTVSTGKVFDGDQQAQGNLLLAYVIHLITGAQETEWTLADNTRTVVTAAEIAEALVLSGIQKSGLWPLEQYL